MPLVIMTSQVRKVPPSLPPRRLAAPRLLAAIQLACRDQTRRLTAAQDTHAKTVALLRTNAYFGMEPSNLHFVTQQNVAAIRDAAGGFAQRADDPFQAWPRPTHATCPLHATP